MERLRAQLAAERAAAAADAAAKEESMRALSRQVQLHWPGLNTALAPPEEVLTSADTQSA